MWAIDVLINNYSYFSGTDKGRLFSSMFCDSEIDTCIRSCNNCNTHITAIHM